MVDQFDWDPFPPFLSLARHLPIKEIRVREALIKGEGDHEKMYNNNNGTFGKRNFSNLGAPYLSRLRTGELPKKLRNWSQGLENRITRWSLLQTSRHWRIVAFPLPETPEMWRTETNCIWLEITLSILTVTTSLWYVELFDALIRQRFQQGKRADC